MTMSAVSQTRRSSRHAVRLEITVNLIAGYVHLGEDDKLIFETFLANVIYDEANGGMMPYFDLPLCYRDPEQSSPFCDESEILLKQEWSDWLQLICSSALFDSERREALREMLGALLRLKRRRRISKEELINVANDTRSWTRCDVKNLKRHPLVFPKRPKSSP